MYVPQARIVHFKGVSVGIRKETQDITNASKKTKQKMVRETTRAMSKFYKKHYGESVLGRIVIAGIKVLSRLRSLKLVFDGD